MINIDKLLKGPHYAEGYLEHMKALKGDIFESDADAILHQVNCQGVMGAGLAKQVKERFPVVFKYYKSLCDEDKRARKELGFSRSPLLGRIQIIHKQDYLIGDPNIDPQVIVNLFAQDRYGKDKCHTDYGALKQCLIEVNKRFAGKKVAIPYRMGCGLGGGDWNVVSKIIENTLIDCDVTLYESYKEKVSSLDDKIQKAAAKFELTDTGDRAPIKDDLLK